MARVTIVLTDEEEGYELAAAVTFEPELDVDIPDPEDLPTPHKAAMVGMQAINAMSATGEADVLELYDREGKDVGGYSDKSGPWA